MSDAENTEETSTDDAIVSDHRGVASSDRFGP